MSSTNTRRLSEIDRKIGANLRAMREFRGLTQSALARTMGITFQQLQKYEKGENRLPVERLHILRGVFDVPYDHFFDGIDGCDMPDMRFEREDPLALKIFHTVRTVRDTALKHKILAIARILAEDNDPLGRTI